MVYDPPLNITEFWHKNFGFWLFDIWILIVDFWPFKVWLLTFDLLDPDYDIVRECMKIVGIAVYSYAKIIFDRILGVR